MKYKNLRIALPATNEPFKRSEKKAEQYWEKQDYPKDLSRIKSRFDWEEYPVDFKEKWYDYIDEEFTRREQGLLVYNNGTPTYITGTHYMYLQWSKLMLEHQILEKQIDYSLYFGKHVKQIQMSTECVILKTDDLDFHLCPQQNSLTKLQYLATPDSVYFLNLVQMLKKCLQIKSYQYPLTILSFSNHPRWYGSSKD